MASINDGPPSSGGETLRSAAQAATPLLPPYGGLYDTSSLALEKEGAFSDVFERPADIADRLGFDFPGWGTHSNLVIEAPSVLPPGRGHDENTPLVVGDVMQSWHINERTMSTMAPANLGVHIDSAHHEEKLGQWYATSICANDITSSCLYTAGIASTTAGRWAPVSLALIALVLYGFRGVYAEVGAALPLNGGSYTLLLNVTSKSIAALASCLSCLSYISTAVVSATSAMSYLKYLVPAIGIWYMTLAVIVLFALVTLMGVTDSARVAFAIFMLHTFTLLALIVAGTVQFAHEPHILGQNWKVDARENPGSAGHEIYRIFAGFCVSALGITGFETSANFIEQQKPGVFPKTLRNMWFAVAFFNPLLGLLSWAVLPYATLMNTANQANLLIHMASASAGPWLGWLVGIDAVLVLCGAVLTAYVGIMGLIKRMALDRCMPQVLLQENSWRRTPHLIILLFCLICCSLYAIVSFNIRTLAGVYTVSFLSVMALFAAGNTVLKWKRGKLPVQSRASWPQAFVCGLSVVAALVGNIVIDFRIVIYFLIYFSAISLVVSSMFARVRLMRFLRVFVKDALPAGLSARLVPWVERQIVSIRNQPIVFFTNTDSLPILNKAVLYTRENELSSWLRICHVYRTEADIPRNLLTNVSMLDQVYPKLRIDLVLVQAPAFNPQIIEQISQRLAVPKNFMLIGCPNAKFPFNVSELGGVRVCTTS